MSSTTQNIYKQEEPEFIYKGREKEYNREYIPCRMSIGDDLDNA